MTQNINVQSILVDGQDAFLKALKINSSIVDYLSNLENPICPLLGKEIKLVKKIGEGTLGEVFEVDFPAKGEKRYVVKREKIPPGYFVIYSKKGATYKQLANNYGVSVLDIISYNALKASPDDLISGDVIIPMFKQECMLKAKTKYERMDGNGFIVLDKGDIVCGNTYTEFMISSLVGELYKSGESINFLNTLYFATCVEGDKLRKVPLWR
jgi:hypothetical protein